MCEWFVVVECEFVVLMARALGISVHGTISNPAFDFLMQNSNIYVPIILIPASVLINLHIYI